MQRFLLLICGLTVLLTIHSHLYADVSAIDDTGKTVTLPKPATRIISMAPNLTEILFHIGAGPQIVGVVEFSDFPLEALELTQIGSSNQVNIEAILALRPDLVVSWESGNQKKDLATLEQLGLPTFRTEPRTLDDIASLMKRLGKLTGSPDRGDALSSSFLKSTAAIRDIYQRRKNIKVFYQIWSDPIYTLNGEHLISRLIEHCGGTNIFIELKTLAPVVSTESVIEKNPDVIIAGGYGGATPEWLDTWNRWSSIQAVKTNNLYTVDADKISRMGPRILEGMGELCRNIDHARSF
uniref:ABC-type Fe3+-hydroxamate transport system, periplasmic component n=1 Tax=uncultured gamma proteobacterium HF0200_24F15 TaxID=723570 RepID=E7C3Z6_9GAMM|nr:ABC-type Fe3+-hydroxamate transport system, periplasmic component [uncultured gamma proteobacterium HF0200_24F15]